MTFFSRYENVNLDRKEIYSLWLKLGSLEKISLYLENKGIINDKVNKPYGTVTLARYAWRYVLDNPDEAYQMVLDGGTEINKDYWEQFLVRKAYGQFVVIRRDRAQFYKWLEKNNLEKYKDYKSQKEFFGEGSGVSDFQKSLLG